MSGAARASSALAFVNVFRDLPERGEVGSSQEGMDSLENDGAIGGQAREGE
jgi:hypothetical protein